MSGKEFRPDYAAAVKNKLIVKFDQAALLKNLETGILRRTRDWIGIS